MTIRPSISVTGATFLLAAAVLGRPYVAGPRVPHMQRARGPVCTLVADPHNKFTYVPPPFRARYGLMTSQLAAVDVTYVGFSAQQQAAFQAAVDIWKTQITSTVPVVIYAEMSTTLGSTTLGSADANFVFRDFTGAPMTGTWYPAALANKLAGRDLNTLGTGNPWDTTDDGQDINARFNANFMWYYGTDGIVPPDYYDFVSVVLHELGHGFGFSGSMDSDGTLGKWGLSTGYPFVYDRFTENGTGTDLLDAAFFPNPSTALHSQLTGNGGGVWWNGANGIAAAGSRPKLYTPASWDSGSSYSHLDDATYPPGNANSLMTHALGSAEAIHDPGPITIGVFQDEGWTGGCPLALSATSTIIGPSGGSGSFTVTTGTGCAWTAISSASWLTISAGASGTGNGTVSYSAAAYSGATRSATITVTVSGLTRTFTVTNGPTMALDRTAIAMGAVNNGGTFGAKTSAQSVLVSFTGVTGAAWTVASSQPWLVVSPASGLGNGQFSISLGSGGSGLPATGSVTGTVAVTSAAAANSPRTIAVTLTLYAAAGQGASGFPVGAFETPGNGAAVQGSIAVTGWALDDIEVDHVEIWRDVVAGETTPPYGGSGPGNGKIYIANPLFITGSRTDVEAAFPSTPMNKRAGWGYLLLTWGLWNQGNGTYNLYAYAFDVEGHYTTIGSKTITVSNATAAKPFGALDTPAYGETKSGTFWNYGWALTPKPNAADGRTCTILNGSVYMSIDSGALRTENYGDPRTDIAALFPGFSNGNNAGGAFSLDTTTLTNGTHNIGWYVVDSCGRADGIGSRFFTVSNSGSALKSGVVSGFSWTGDSRTIPDRVLRVAPGERLEIELPRGGGAYAGGQIVNGELRALPLGSSIDQQRGVFQWAPAPGFLGAYDLVFGRDVQLPPSRDALWRTAEALAEAGEPDVTADTRSVRLEPDVHPDLTARVVVGPSIRMTIDTPLAGSAVSSWFTIAGWALDLAAADGSGIDTVHVWAYPLSGPAKAGHYDSTAEAGRHASMGPIFLGADTYRASRRDVGITYGAQFTPSGFNIPVSGLAPGTYDIVVYPHSVVDDAFVGAQVLRVTIQ